MALGELAIVGGAFFVGVCGHAPSRREAFLTGTAAGAVFMIGLLAWLETSIGWAAWVGLAAGESLWFGLAGLVISVVWHVTGGPVWAAVTWGAVELLRSSVPFGGFPWGRVGFSVVDTTWQGLLPYAGVAGTSVMLVLLGGLAVRVVEALVVDRTRGRVVWAVGGLVAVATASLVPLPVPFVVAPSGTLMVAVVQGDVPGEGDDIGSFGRQVTRSHVEATVALGDQVDEGRAPRPDLIVWPENSTALDPFSDDETRSGIELAVREVGAPVLVGGIVDADQPDRVLNQGIVWAATGPTGQRYTKHHPVPFGEYIPFRPVLEGVSDRLRAIPRDMVSGSGSAPLEIGAVAVADAICFDVAYGDVIGPQVRAGAQVVVVQTSNATFVGTAQLDQQFAITRARALETGRAIAVASTNGITGLIGPDGTVVQQAPKRTTRVLVGDLPLSTTITPAVRAARGIELGILAGSVVGILLSVRRGRRLPSHRPSSTCVAPGVSVLEGDSAADRPPRRPR